VELIPQFIKLDGRQSETALAIQRGVGRLMRAFNFAYLYEFTLTTGRRADVIGIGANGTVWIIEIKSSVEDFRVDTKWPEYRDYCDRLFFAIPQTLDPDIMPADAGLIIADQWGAEMMRDAPETGLHASRRKAVTLSFARTAAQRLQGLTEV
jgi:hypothetical protein